MISNNTMNALMTIRKVSLSDISLLHEISRKAYSENFAHHWNKGGLEWYLEKIFSLEILESELESDSIYYYISFVHDIPAGFMKLNVDSQLPSCSLPAIELDKLYIRPQFHYSGIGKALMNLAIRMGKECQRKIMWLSVIDTNLPAIEFYKQQGFQFFDKITLDWPYFKDELRGMHRMVLSLS